MASLLTVPAKLYPRAISELMVGSATQVAFYGLQTSVTCAIPTPWVACMQRQGCTGVGGGGARGIQKSADLKLQTEDSSMLWNFRL